MRQSLVIPMCILLAGCGGGGKASRIEQVFPPAPVYPMTRQVTAKDTIHGVEVADPYRWLEDEKSPEVQTWMKAQDGLTRSYLSGLPGRAAIADRLRQLMYVDEILPPTHRGTRYFYGRRHANKEKRVYYWREGNDGEERVLFDPNTWSADGSLSLGTFSISENGTTVAYTVRQNNADEAILYVMDVATGRKSTVDVIDGAKYASPSWTPDGKGFYYTWLPTDPRISAADRPGFAEVRYHRLGEDPKKDVIVHERTNDPRSFLGCTLSRDGRWLIFQIQHGWTSADVWFRDLKGAADGWTPLVTGKDAMYNVLAWRDAFYVHTNEGAGRWRVFRVNPLEPGRSSWREIVPEQRDATLEGAGIVGEHLSLSYTKDAASRIEVRTLEGVPVREVTLPGVGSASGLLGNEDEDEAYFAFGSYTVPREIYVTSVKSGETRLWSRLKLPLDSTPYTVGQMWFRSKDGTRVPMFLVHRKDLKKDGSNPVLLTGYGGFQVSLSPAFSASAFPWLERGGIYAEVNLRGGSEFGEEWHRAGMLDRKQNVFDDFSAAANFLISQGYTRPARLAIQGGSNGGLLVGAALTQNPGLYRVVICAVPLIDMIRYHLFGSGKTWVSEYGSAEHAGQFRSLLAYSPYHHVKPATRYPTVLLLSADSDDRVDPMHARKFAAALQAASTNGPVLLRIESHAGHGGADMIKAAIEEDADSLAFIYAQMGIRP